MPVRFSSPTDTSLCLLRSLSPTWLTVTQPALLYYAVSTVVLNFDMMRLDSDNRCCMTTRAIRTQLFNSLHLYTDSVEQCVYSACARHDRCKYSSSSVGLVNSSSHDALEHHTATWWWIRPRGRLQGPALLLY